MTDIHHEMVALGSVPRVRSAAGEPQMIPSYRHRACDYLGAALPTGLRLLACEEPRLDRGDTGAPMPAAVETPPWDTWPWSLHAITPAATGAAFGATPSAVLWHFRMPETLNPREAPA